MDVASSKLQPLLPHKFKKIAKRLKLLICLQEVPLSIESAASGCYIAGVERCIVLSPQDLRQLLVTTLLGKPFAKPLLYFFLRYTYFRHG